MLDMFVATLDPAWEIYIQPHLNGLRPDFVLLHPDIGIAVYEVKDWNLDAMHYFVRKREGKRPELWARKDGQEFSHQSDNPVTKVEQYQDAIYNLYCPRLQRKKGFGAITAGVIFPFADRGRLQALFAPFLKNEENEAAARYLTLSGARDVADRNIGHVFPDASRTHSILMRPELADDLRGWLVEPDVAATQRQPLELDAVQRQLAQSRTTTGYRRIKGPAGSGKSLVLAARAARLADEGKSVLVATFNITLWHYLRDLIVRALEQPGSHRNIIFCNFHSWCKSVCDDVGWRERYDDLWKGNSVKTVIETGLPNLVAMAAGREGAPEYDAILVDEGQDYRPLWWNTLRRFLNADGEMLMVADATQDIYGTARSWTDEAMTGAGFRGSWGQLEISYRLPPAAVPAMREFAERFMPDDRIELPAPQQQAALDLSPCRLRWVQCSPSQVAEACAHEVQRMMHFTGKSALANADITFLTADVASGAAVVEQLARQGIKCVATYDADEKERRRQKVGFFMGDARIKATTLHSFKGWEASLLVVHVGQAKGKESLALIYTGLTRLKQSSAGSRLTVVSSSPELLDYAMTWQNFVDRRAADSGLATRLVATGDA